MNDDPVVNLYPNNLVRPTSWTSQDDGAPPVILRKEHGLWVARFDRKPVATAPSAEALTAHLYGEYGLLAVLNERAIEV